MKEPLRLPFRKVLQCSACDRPTANYYHSGLAQRVVLCRECYELASVRSQRGGYNDFLSIKKQCHLED